MLHVLFVPIVPAVLRMQMSKLLLLCHQGAHYTKNALVFTFLSLTSLLFANLTCNLTK